MRTIKISEEVWSEIAKKGVFGETPDDVLRRIFEISAGNNENRTESSSKASFRTRRAKDKLFRIYKDGCLVLTFASGPSRKFPLPAKDNKKEISNLTDEVIKFIKDHGGTLGQQNAGRKALTDSGYHIIGPNYR